MSRSASYDYDNPFPGARQVAVVIAALGNELGSKVLAHFSAPEVEAIIREVKDMDGVPAGEVSGLMERLRDEAVAHSYAINGGIERARDLLRRSHGEEADQILDQILAASNSIPFQFLRSRRPDQIVSYLSAEHPQVIALVLAHLPLAMAGLVIEGLPVELRSDVAERYAKLESIDPMLVSEVEAALLRRVGSKTTATETTTTKGGVKPLAQMLNSVGRDTEKSVLGDLERADPDLAGAIRDLMFVFEDIGSIDERGLQELLRQADTKTIALSLKDTTPLVEGQDRTQPVEACGRGRRRVRRLARDGAADRRRGSPTGDRPRRPQDGGRGQARPRPGGQRQRRRRRVHLMSRVLREAAMAATPTALPAPGAWDPTTREVFDQGRREGYDEGFGAGKEEGYRLGRDELRAIESSLRTATLSCIEQVRAAHSSLIDRVVELSELYVMTVVRDLPDAAAAGLLARMSEAMRALEPAALELAVPAGDVDDVVRLLADHPDGELLTVVAAAGLRPGEFRLRGEYADVDGCWERYLDAAREAISLYLIDGSAEASR